MMCLTFSRVDIIGASNGDCLEGRVVKLPVMYVGGKLPVTYRPLLARLGHLALVLKGAGQSLGLNIFLAISLLHSEHFLDTKFATLVCN